MCHNTLMRIHKHTHTHIHAHTYKIYLKYIYVCTRVLIHMFVGMCAS